MNNIILTSFIRHANENVRFVIVTTSEFCPHNRFCLRISIETVSFVLKSTYIVTLLYTFYQFWGDTEVKFYTTYFAQQAR